MRIKLDENMPGSLATALAAMGHDVDTSPDEGLAGKIDEVIWQAAQDSGRFLITQDLDFSDLRVYQPGTHHGLLLIRLHNPTRSQLRERINSIFADEDVENWVGCLVVVTNRKIRIKQPDSDG